jgi:drug/metabolite transporter (DMT)-like permease
VTVTGDILMAIGYFFWALEANLIRLMDPSVPAVVMLAAKTMATSLVMAVLSLWKGSGLAVPRSTIPAIVASGGVFLVLSVLFYYTATRLIGAGRCGLIISTSGFFGTMGAVLFLREAFSTGMIAPISVIALGLAALVGVSPASRSRSRSSDGHGGS